MIWRLFGTEFDRGEHAECIPSFGFGLGWIVFMVFILLCIMQGYGVEHSGKFCDSGVIWRLFGTALDRGKHCDSIPSIDFRFGVIVFDGLEFSCTIHTTIKLSILANF